MAMLPVTVTILTKNESAIIERCISSVAWASEILVLDSGSTDNTKELAIRSGAVVHEQNWLGWTPQRQRAIELAKNDWVFILEADEIVTPELANSIIEALSNDPKGIDGFAVDRRDEIFGKMLPNMRRDAKRMAFVRLFNRKFSRYNPDEPIHETVIYTGHAHMLSGILLHWRNVKFADQSHKDVDNAKLEADMLTLKGFSVHWYHFFSRPLLRFLWCYVKCGGARAGMAGLVQALMRANSEYLRVAILWERQQTKSMLHPPASVWDVNKMPNRRSNE